MLVMCIALNFAAGTVINYAYHVDSGTVNQVVRINNFLAEHKDARTIYITQDEPIKRYDRFGRYMDTYIEGRKNFYFVRDTSLEGSNNISVAGITIKAD